MSNQVFLKTMEIASICHALLADPGTGQIQPFGNGHIHDTYLAGNPQGGAAVILQRINTGVFREPLSLIRNHLKLLEWLHAQSDPLFSLPHLLPFDDGNHYHIDPEDGFWRASRYIRDSRALDICQNVRQAHGAGKAFGWFAGAFRHLPPDALEEPIPLFHDLRFRLDQFREAQATDKAGRKQATALFIDFFESRTESLLELYGLIRNGDIPLRVTHNDTKINNVLFRGEDAVAVIDLDTTGPGTLLYDYGDALRTLACTAAEDELDSTKVDFHLPFFESFSRSYLEQVGPLQATEAEYLFMAPRLMTFIMGIRFLTDFLNGDTYYKIKYPEHNLVRTQVQQTLIRRIEAKETEIRRIIRESKKNQ